MEECPEYDESLSMRLNAVDCNHEIPSTDFWRSRVAERRDSLGSKRILGCTYHALFPSRISGSNEQKGPAAMTSVAADVGHSLRYCAG